MRRIVPAETPAMNLPAPVRNERVNERGLMKKLLAGFAAILVAWLAAAPAHALPLFARQTGQRCVTCHAGGQFPELTPFGRNFKLTGYTLGERQTIPLAAMAVLSNTHVADTSKSDDPAQDFQKNGSTILAQASVFTG